MFIPKRIVYLFSLFLLLALIIAPVSPARASPVRHCYVNDNAAGANNGDSWTDAYTSLQSALGDINCTEIWVAEGVYYPGAAGNRTATFTLKNGVAVYGGFAGTESSRDERDWQINLTILSGDIDGNDTNTDGNFIAETTADIQGSNAYHVVTSDSTVDTAVLDGFIITAGQANGSDTYDIGGGMYNDNSSPTLTNVAFSGNSAYYRGGGMFNWYSSPILMDVTFCGNSIISSEVFNSSGGGMYNVVSDPTLTNVTFSGNSAYYSGGGMYNDNSNSPTLTNVTFGSNSAQYGGGMFNLSSNPTLTNVTFSDNSFTVSKEIDSSGGGMYNRSSSPTLTNVTFSGNSANSNGGGMYNIGSSNPTLTNVIMWGDSALYGPEIYNDNSDASISYSDIEGCIVSGSWNSACGADSGHNIDADPLFVDATGGNLRLQLISPAIDAGNNAAVPITVTTDLDGNPRFVDIPTVPDTGTGTPPIVDMGAYEATFTVFLPLVLR
jgi:predicted outer membrane repeat protein